MTPLLLSLLLLAGPPADTDVRPATEVAPTPPDLSRFLPREDLESDGRRTLGQLPKNVGRSFVGVFSKENVGPMLMGTAAATGSYFFDQRTRSSLLGQAPRISDVASRAGNVSYMLPATVGLLAAGRFSGSGRFRAFSYDVTQSMVVNTVYTAALKKLASRARPDGSNRLSFPSGHTSSTFAWATVAQAHYGWKAGLPSYAAAGLIGLSRITNDKHHLSDVVAGATIGYVTARTVVRANGDPARGKTLALHPMTDAAGSGLGLGASISW